MRNLLTSLALIAFVAIPGQALAEGGGSLNDAIRLCRAEVAAQAGVAVEQARFDEARTRSRAYRVDIDLWRDGRLTNVRCDVDRTGEQLAIAALNPALQTATASAASAAGAQ